MVLTVDPAVLPAMFNAVLNKAISDSVFKAKVDASAMRVLTAKQNRGLLAQGMDVNSAQGSVDWQAAYNNGARFAYVKATEGTTYTNPSFAQQYNGSYNIGMIRGAYHFAHPDSSTGTVQADYFLAHGGGWSGDGRTLPPALDLQNNPSGAQCYGLSAAAMVNWIKAFSDEVHLKTVKYQMITTSFAWWNACTANSSAFAATNPFWLDSYTGTPPSSIPAGTATWTMWQSATSGLFPGGQDQFNGNWTQLQALAPTTTNPRPPGHTTQLLGALLGTNAGPLILLWGSVATLLWRQRCKPAAHHPPRCASPPSSSAASRSSCSAAGQSSASLSVPCRSTPARPTLERSPSRPSGTVQ